MKTNTVDANDYAIDNLNKVRNEIIGSNENKLEYINNLKLKR
jgi:hypothetical protein